MHQTGKTGKVLEAAVDSLLLAAFDTGAEAELVKRLRADKVMATEIVHHGDDRLNGYAALSYMTAPTGWLCLAPVAVSPKSQGQGVGGQVLKLVLKWALDRGHHVVVLGDPDFYGRHGFSSARAANLRSPYPISHTLLAGPGDDAPAETLVYPAAFGGDV